MFSLGAVLISVKVCHGPSEGMLVDLKDKKTYRDMIINTDLGVISGYTGTDRKDSKSNTTWLKLACFSPASLEGFSSW